MGLRGPVTDAQADDLDRITRGQRTLLTLINDILSFAKVEAGRIELALTDVRVADLFAEVEELIAPQVRARKVAYHVSTCPADAVARADPDKVRQILANLLANALKFTPSGGTVEMGCTTTAAHVVISVRDTGRGIPPDKISSIFEPFMQIDTARTREHDGVGLGLAISSEFAKAMGGDITAESQPGEGSTFLVTLPRVRVSGGSLLATMEERIAGGAHDE
jgi:signal transduction histidine kinase